MRVSRFDSTRKLTHTYELGLLIVTIEPSLTSSILHAMFIALDPCPPERLPHPTTRATHVSAQRKQERSSLALCRSDVVVMLSAGPLMIVYCARCDHSSVNDVQCWQVSACTVAVNIYAPNAPHEIAVVSERQPMWLVSCAGMLHLTAPRSLVRVLPTRGV